MDDKSKIGIQPDLACLRVFMKEMLIDIADPKVQYTEIARKQVFEEIAYDFKIFGLKDPETDIKNDPKCKFEFIHNFRKDPLHPQFREAWEKR